MSDAFDVLMAPAEEGAYAPECGEAEWDDKRHTNCPARHRAFAPALEHSHKSNNEQKYGNSAEGLYEHGNDLGPQIHTWSYMAKGHRSRARVMVAPAPCRLSRGHLALAFGVGRRGD